MKNDTEEFIQFENLYVLENVFPSSLSLKHFRVSLLHALIFIIKTQIYKSIFFCIPYPSRCDQIQLQAQSTPTQNHMWRGIHKM